MQKKEIERKYLIRYPELDSLAGQCSHVYTIEQTYLLSRPSVTLRVRRRSEGKKTEYFYTEKERISGMTALEREREISLEEYEHLLGRRDPSLQTIQKTRYCLPWGNHLFEIDVYYFWRKIATMEVEMDWEGETFDIPSECQIIKDITDDYSFKNESLSKNAPDENLVLFC